MKSFITLMLLLSMCLMLAPPTTAQTNITKEEASLTMMMPVDNPVIAQAEVQSLEMPVILIRALPIEAVIQDQGLRGWIPEAPTNPLESEASDNILCMKYLSPCSMDEHSLIRVAPSSYYCNPLLN